MRRLVLLLGLLALVACAGAEPAPAPAGGEANFEEYDDGDGL
jgi:hypothetical protein